MPRKPRLHLPGALYHVISRGNNRQEIFSLPIDYQQFIGILKKIKEKYPFRLHAYCLMPNHFHLLVEAGTNPISVILQRLLTGYTRYFNKLNKRKGHLFQGRYKAIICEKDAYLMELVRYIHLNPVRAKMAPSPGDWKWCGHREYLSEESKLVDRDQVLHYFGKDINAARRNYAEFVREGLVMGHQSEYYPEEKIPYVGNNVFIEKLISKHEDIIVNMTPEKQKKPKESMSAVAQRIARQEKIEEAAIMGDSRSKAVAAARRKFVLLTIQEGHKAADIARFLNRSQGYITQVLSS